MTTQVEDEAKAQRIRELQLQIEIEKLKAEQAKLNGANESNSKPAVGTPGYSEALLRILETIHSSHVSPSDLRSFMYSDSTGNVGFRSAEKRRKRAKSGHQSAS